LHTFCDLDFVVRERVAYTVIDCYWRRISASRAITRILRKISTRFSNECEAVVVQQEEVYLSGVLGFRARFFPIELESADWAGHAFAALGYGRLRYGHKLCATVLRGLVGAASAARCQRQQRRGSPAD
jgi:hypothetical protein